MSVMCDTEKVAVYKNGNVWSASIRGLRNKNGNPVIVKLADYTEKMSKDELYTIFFEKLEKGEIKGTKRTGGGIVRQNDDGEYYIEYPESTPKEGTILAQIEKKKVGETLAPAVSGVVTKGQTLFDPHAPEARALIGRPVIGSTTFVFSEGTYAVGVLEAINGAFSVRTKIGIIKYPFVRELKPEPLNFNSTETRRALMGKVLVSRDGKHELLVTTFLKDGNVWKANGMTSSQIMNNYMYEDGSDIVLTA